MIWHRIQITLNEFCRGKNGGRGIRGLVVTIVPVVFESVGQPLVKGDPAVLVLVNLLEELGPDRLPHVVLFLIFRHFSLLL